MRTCQGWNLHLRRNLNDEEVERIGALYNTLPFQQSTWGRRYCNVKVMQQRSLLCQLLHLVADQRSRVAVPTRENMKKRKYQLCSKCLSTSYGDYSCVLRKITWVKPRNIGVLKCWIRVRNAKEKAERWKIVP
ncbi:hypothetical protein H5410_030433 [Solanum commersonii]|uniref:Uncharacterized protein n=1 Tax=Solanum commersonii TaxID=4109 RepID=A0A9J5YGV2_SOLCO|nr:hypothetical protein H5410_030433 [Solanum commersonii]